LKFFKQQDATLGVTRTHFYTNVHRKKGSCVEHRTRNLSIRVRCVTYRYTNFVCYSWNSLFFRAFKLQQWRHLKTLFD